MVMALFWRVKAFEVVVSAYTNGPLGSQYTDTFTMRVGDMDASKSGFSTERDLICSTDEWWDRSNYGTTAIDIGLSNTYPVLVDGGNYLVSFSVGDGGESFSSIYDPDNDFGINGTWTMNFSGYSFTKELYRAAPDSGPASVIMNATEYWPYDTGDGLGPTYNTATGALVRA
jgi:hypothetical protein